jgi:hypothetical protein
VHDVGSQTLQLLVVRRMHCRGRARVKKLTRAVIHINMCDDIALLIVKKAEAWSKRDPDDMFTD